MTPVDRFSKDTAGGEGENGSLNVSRRSYNGNAGREHDSHLFGSPAGIPITKSSLK